MKRTRLHRLFSLATLSLFAILLVNNSSGINNFLNYTVPSQRILVREEKYPKGPLQSVNVTEINNNTVSNSNISSDSVVNTRTVSSSTSPSTTTEIGTTVNVSKIYLRPTQNSSDGDSVYDVKEIEQHLASRRKQMTSYCKAQKRKHMKPTTNLLVNDDRKFIYCMVYKVASSATKKALINGTSVVPVNNSYNLAINNWTLLKHYGFRPLLSYKPSQRDFRLRSYYKIMFVRHPFRRLLSAFRDRFEIKESREMYRMKFGRQIIQRYRRNPSALSLKQGHDVTFQEFVRYVIDEARQRHNMDGHWRTFQEACQPCAVGYDAVGHLETINQDLAYFMQKINARRRSVVLTQYGPSSKDRNVSTDDAYKQYFSQIPKRLIDDLYKVYKDDFLMFGYTRDI